MFKIFRYYYYLRQAKKKEEKKYRRYSRRLSTNPRIPNLFFHKKRMLRGIYIYTHSNLSLPIVPPTGWNISVEQCETRRAAWQRSKPLNFCIATPRPFARKIRSGYAVGKQESGLWKGMEETAQREKTRGRQPVTQLTTKLFPLIAGQPAYAPSPAPFSRTVLFLFSNESRTRSSRFERSPLSSLLKNWERIGRAFWNRFWEGSKMGIRRETLYSVTPLEF